MTCIGGNAGVSGVWFLKAFFPITEGVGNEADSRLGTEVGRRLVKLHPLLLALFQND
jgi:hypothetical protein